MEVWPMIRHLLVSEKLNVQMAGFAMKEENIQMEYLDRKEEFKEGQYHKMVREWNAIVKKFGIDTTCLLYTSRCV